MEHKPFIPVILGTARDGRNSEAVARFVYERLSAYPDVRTQLVDVKEYLFDGTIPDDGDHPHAHAWRKIAAEADGFLIVSPEYNHGYPGELKQLLDCAFDEYARKPVGICGVSNGLIGGARMVEQLRLVCITLALVPVRAAVYFPRVQDLVDKQGKIVSGTNEKQLIGLFEELVWYATTLKSGSNKKA